MLAQVNPTDCLSHGNVRIGVGNLETLIASIKEHGIIQPPVVIPTDDESDTWVIVTGHRRIAAAVELDLPLIDVIVDNAADAADIIAIQYTENMEREDLSAYEQCQVAWDLKLEGLNQTAVANAMGLTQAMVSRYQKTAKHVAMIEPAAATQLTHDGLFDLVELTTPETASDVLDVILSGVHIQSAIRQVETDAIVIEFYEAIGPMQKEWADLGIEVTMDDPRFTDDLDQWGQPKRDLNVKLLRDLEIYETDHISLDCHVIWINANVGGHRPPSVSQWCTDAKMHTPTKSRTPDLVSPAAQHSGEVREASSIDRKKLRDAKKLRIRQGGEWLKIRSRADDREAWAIDRALTGWRQEDVRAACDMLDLTKDRPKGAEFDWYDEAFDAWMDVKFEDNTLARDRFRVQVMIAQQYINGGWRMNPDFMSRLQDIEVPDVE